jgi:hypothetical protein
MVLFRRRKGFLGFVRSKVLYFFGGALKGKTKQEAVGNFVSNFFCNGIFYMSLNFSFFSLKKALNLIYSHIEMKRGILIGSHLLELRDFFACFRRFFFFRKFLKLTSYGWSAGTLSNFLYTRRIRFFPDLVVAPAADFDAHIVKEAFIVLRPCVALTGGKFSVNFSDYPMFSSGNLVSFGKAITKLIVDGYFLRFKKKKNVHCKNS